MIKKKRRKKEICPNCKVGLNSNNNFCHNCGQENHQKRASVKMLVTDFSQDYFTFDSKLFRSLKPLLFKPGFLTLEFIKGKRMNYIKPIRLYLFISFIFFLTISLISKQEQKQSLINLTYKSETFTEDQKTMKEALVVADSLENQGQFFNASIEKKMSYYVNTEEGEKVFKKKLTNNVPIFLFFTIPILAFIFFIFFSTRKHFYVDHLIFTLHIQSFIFLMILFFTILNKIIGDFKYDQLLQFVIGVTYIIVAIKKTYSVTYLGSILRTISISIVHTIITSILLVMFMAILILI